MRKIHSVRALLPSQWVPRLINGYHDSAGNQRSGCEQRESAKQSFWQSITRSRRRELGGRLGRLVWLVFRRRQGFVKNLLLSRRPIYLIGGMLPRGNRDELRQLR